MIVYDLTSQQECSKLRLGDPMADADLTKPKPKRVRGRRTASVPETPDPVEIAMKAIASGADQHSAARAVLEKHACLIDIQCRREREELANVRVQRITRWLILSGLAGVLIGLGAAVWSASRSTALVVEPFRVPQEMSQRGIDGPAVAAQLLDRLSDLQEQTQSGRAASSYANNWGDNLAVAIPETGISLGEAWRFLRSWLGNETRITGEVWRAQDGTITVTARAGASPARSFSGPESELNRLMTQAAESVYSVTQPYRFFVYASNGRRFSEAQTIAARLLASPDPNERKWAHVAATNLARLRGDIAESNRHARMALEIDPDLSVAQNNIAINAAALGRPQQQLATLRHSLEMQDRNVRDERYDAAALEGAIATNRRTVQALLGDFQNAGQLEQAVGRMNAQRARVLYLETVLWQLALHEPSAASRSADQLAALVRPGDVEDLAMVADRRLRIAMARGNAAEIRQHLAAAVGAADRFAAHPDPYRHGLGRVWKVRYGWASEAAALSALGEHQAALAVARRMPVDCYECLLVRGDVFAAADDRRAAELEFAEAARQGPELPFAHSRWGQARLAWGDVPGAIIRFEEAHRRGPRFADPLRYWGDALMRLNRVSEAEQRYAMAAERAPRWGSLHLAWANSLWRLGRRDEARQKLRAAAHMDLTATERALLQRIMAAAT